MKEYQNQVERILGECGGDTKLTFEQLLNDPNLYQHVVQNLDVLIEKCYSYYIKQGKKKGVDERADRVFHAIGDCLAMDWEFQKKYKAEAREKGMEGYYLSKFGSSLNGTLTKNSDLDLTLVTDDS